MESFPEYLNTKAKSHFSTRLLLLMKKKLRKEIHNLIIRSNESDYFAIDDFCDKNDIPISKVVLLIEEIRDELASLGWRTKTSFGGTGLFIYSTEKPPPNCYPDEF